MSSKSTKTPIEMSKHKRYLIDQSDREWTILEPLVPAAAVCALQARVRHVAMV